MHWTKALACCWLGTAALAQAPTPQAPPPGPQPPPASRPPLHPRAYLDLPLGAIEPRGWLRLQLERMRDGMTGHLDALYPQVLGPTNGWLGGDGDGWERGPYWLDGLVPLAWQLRDEALQQKARRWIDWTLEHQEPDGYLGPKRFDREPEREPGVQKTPREDWWPRMVMLKVLQQYWSATGDARVPEVLRRYCHYQLAQLRNTPLDHWSFWANRRGGDNELVVQWLYDLTGDEQLLPLIDLLAEQTFPYSAVFRNDRPLPSPDLRHLYPYNTGNRFPFDEALLRRLSVDQLQAFHCVNLAQGLKQPVVHLRRDGNIRHVHAVRQALAQLRRFHGQPQGMYGADEPLHGTDPTQGIELCAVVELLFSLETMVSLTGDAQLADQAEWIAYNALPAQTTTDQGARQYFQCANQVLATRARRNFYEEDWHGGTDLCFGLLTGYSCCTCNMHQGWPKWTQQLWRSTPDGGLAALAYGPCAVDWRVGEGAGTGGGTAVRVVEDTNYPFEERVRLQVEPARPVTFPLHLRVPGWAGAVTLRLNGEQQPATPVAQRLTLKREWRAGDTVELRFAAEVRTSRWHENSIAVERGPLLYALRIDEQWSEVDATDAFGPFLEVRPGSAWNYGLTAAFADQPAAACTLASRGFVDAYPWSLAGAPLELRVPAKRIPEWQLYGDRAGPLPHSRPIAHLRGVAAAEVVLVPYGCTRLRISEFPVVE